MTDKQIKNYNRMHNALKTIAKNYKSSEQIQRSCEKEYGLSYSESLEMAYDNIQNIAKM